jgi:hypothetical protein
MYDSRRASWIACYPNVDFLEDAAAERRATIVADRSAPTGISQRELDISVAVILLIEIVATVYLYFRLLG